jgi:hypothetical protein
MVQLLALGHSCANACRVATNNARFASDNDRFRRPISRAVDVLFCRKGI